MIISEERNVQTYLFRADASPVKAILYVSKKKSRQKLLVLCMQLLSNHSTKLCRFETC